MKVSQVMHANPVCVALNATLTTIAKQMKEGDFGTVIVKDNDKALGIITDRDIVIRALIKGGNIDTITAKDVMTKTLESCSANDTLVQAADKMKTKKVRRLLVMDEKSAPIGILSLGDIAATATKDETDSAFKALKGCSKPH
ncbi:MAG: CBS domain-containing protein [Candidatus Berkiella sp.]